MLPLLLLLIGLCVMVTRTAHRPKKGDVAAGGPDVATGSSTALEQRLEAKIAATVDHHIYVERWSHCLHDFPKNDRHYVPFPGVSEVVWRECRDCGWVEGLAA